MKKITLQDIESYIQTESVDAEIDGGIHFYFYDEEDNGVSVYRGFYFLKKCGCIDKKGEYNTDFDTLENPEFRLICEELLEKYEEEYC